MNDITKVTLLYSANGIDLTPKKVVYVDQSPFVCLSALWNTHYISSYNGESIFPLFMTNIRYSISIEKYGKVNTLSGFALTRYPTISLVIEENEDFSLAHEIVTSDDEEAKERYNRYLQYISSKKDDIPDLQAAIDYYDIYEDIELTDTNVAWKQITDYVNQNGLNKYTIPILSYVMDMITTNIK